jgi:hypothetical protein
VQDNAEGKVLRERLMGLNRTLLEERRAAVTKAKKKGLGAYATNAGAAAHMKRLLRGAHLTYGGAVGGGGTERPSTGSYGARALSASGSGGKP